MDLTIDGIPGGGSESLQDRPTETAAPSRAKIREFARGLFLARLPACGNPELIKLKSACFLRKTGAFSFFASLYVLALFCHETALKTDGICDEMACFRVEIVV